MSNLLKSPMKRANIFLLSAPPGTGKSTFALNFLEEGFKQDQPGIMIMTDVPPDDIISNALSFGFEWKKNVISELLKVIDCYSYNLGESESKYFVRNPKNLSDISITLREAMGDEKSGRLVLDSASTLLLLTAETTGVSFLSILSSRLKRDDFISLFILEGGVHDTKIIHRLRYLLDGVLDMKVEEIESEIHRFFRIYSLRGCQHDTRWVPFNIGDKGFTLEI